MVARSRKAERIIRACTRVLFASIGATWSPPLEAAGVDLAHELPVDRVTVWKWKTGASKPGAASAVHLVELQRPGCPGAYPRVDAPLRNVESRGLL